MANNELDAAFESEFGPVPKMDPLSEEVTQMKQETLSRLKVSINAASSMNPDQRADIMKIAKDRKIPVGVVERGYDHFAKEKKAQAVDVNRIVDEAPGLAEWLANPNNAAIAQDDLEAINDLRETVKDRGELEKMYNTLGYGFASLNSRIAKVPALIADTYYQYGVNPLAKALGYAEAKPLEGLRNNTLTNSLDSAAEAYKSKVPELSEDILAQIESGNFGKASRALAYQVVGNLPQQALTIGGAMLGTPAVGLAMSASVSASGEYDQAMDQGADPMRAINNAILSGSAEALGESLGTLPLLKKWGATVGARYGKDTWARIMKDVAKTIVISGAQEGAEEAATSAMQDLSAVTTGVNPDLTIREAGRNMVNSALVGMGSGVAVTSPAGAAMGVARRHDMNMAQQTADFLQAIGDKTKDLKLRKRLPEAAQQMVEQLTKDGPVENVYIKPEDFKSYFQSKNLDPLEAATLFGVAKEFQESQETGTDIRVPLSKFVSNLVDTEHYQGLKNSVKFNPESLSLNEAKAEEKKLKADLKLVAQDAEQDTETVPTPIQEAREVKRIVKERLLAMNNPLIDSNVAEQNALLHAQSMLSLSSRSGLSPMELLNRYGLKIQTQDGVIDIPGQDVVRSEPEANVVSEDATEPVEVQRDEAGAIVYDVGNLAALRRVISESEIVQGTVKRDDEGYAQGFIGGTSTFPEFFKNKGYTKQAVLKAIDKQTAGEALTEKQQEILDDLYSGYIDSLNRGQLYQKAKDRTLFQSSAARKVAQEITEAPKIAPSKKVLAAVAAVKEALADPTKVVLFNSASAERNADIEKYGIVPQHGSWVKEIAEGTGADPDEILEAAPELAYYDERPEWVFAQLGRAMAAKKGKHWTSYEKITRKDISANAQLSVLIIDRTDSDFKKVAEDGESFVDLEGNRVGYFENEIGPEPGNVVTEELFKADFAMAGEDVIQFLKAAYPDVLEEFNQRREDSPRILFQSQAAQSVADVFPAKPAPPTFSKLIALVEQKMGGSADPQQIRAMLKDIKEEEKKWLGVEEFLAGKEKVKKQDFLDFLRANEPEIVDVTKDDGSEKASQLEKIKQDMEPFIEQLQPAIDRLAKATGKTRSEVGLRVLYTKSKSGLEKLLGDFVDDSQTDALDGFGDLLERRESLISTSGYDDMEGTFLGDERYSQCTIPGGENYREVLFTLPNQRAVRAEEIVDAASFEKGKELEQKYGMTYAEALKAINPDTYKSSHFPDLNILAHVRLNDRIDADGKKVLFVEEIQSDWHQDGRKRGYRNTDKIAEAHALSQQEAEATARAQSAYKILVERAGAILSKYDIDGAASPGSLGAEILVRNNLNSPQPSITWAQERIGPEAYDDLINDTEALDALSKWQVAYDDSNSLQSRRQQLEDEGGGSSSVPDAPFKKTWHEYAFKRIVRMAAEGGYDRIAWTTGEQQADRFSLAKQVDSVQAFKKSDGTFDVEALKDGRIVSEELGVPESRLESLFGKDLATKIVAESGPQEKSGYRSYQGDDLKVGGEGMKGFYDKILVDYAKKFGKKFGATVGETKINADSKPDLYVQEMADGRFGVFDRKTLSSNAIPAPVDDFSNKAAAESYIKTNNENRPESGEKVHSLDVTEKMKEVALGQGFELFQSGVLPEFKVQQGMPPRVEVLSLPKEQLSFENARKALLGDKKEIVAKLRTGGSVRINDVVFGETDHWLYVRAESEFRKSLSSEEKNAAAIIAKNLDKLMPTLVQEAFEKNYKTEKKVDVLDYRRLYGVVEIGGEQYAFKLKTARMKDRAKGETAYFEYARKLKSPTRSEASKVDQVLESKPTSPDRAEISIGEFAEKINSIRNDDPYFQSDASEAGPRGRIVISSNKTMRIDLFAKADLSTFLHETGHFYLEIIDDLVKDPRTSQSLKDDYEKIRIWLGAKPGEKLTVEQHEQWARGFELYLAKGQAPTNELKRAFAHFRVWLTRIYKNLRELNVELTPEIVGVMDRLVATDEQLAAAVRDQQPLFENPLEAGMNEAQSEKYKKLDNDRKREASEELTREAIKAEMQKREAAYKAVRKEVRERIEKEANEMRVYRALSILQKGKMPDGSALPEGTQKVKLDRQSIVNAYGKEFLEKLPRPFVYSRDGGVDFNVAAEMLGYESGDALLTAIAGMPSKDEYVERETEREMALRFPDEVMQEFPEAAVRAAHNESRGKMIYFELETLAKDNLPLLKDAIKRVARRVPTEKEVRDHARTIIAKKNRAEVRPVIYERAERKAAKEAGELLAKGDIYGAFEAKRRELLNFELYRAAVEATETYEKALEFFKKYNGKDEDLAKTRDMDIVNVGRAILAQHGLGRSEKTPEQFLEQMKRYNPENYDSAISLIQNSGLMPGPYKEISFDEFSNMYETVRALWSLAKNARSVEIDGVRMDRDQIIDELAMRVDEVSKPGQRYGYDKAVTDWEKAKMKLMGARASLRRVESWVSAIDGESRGVFRKYIWNPIVESTARYRTAKVEVLTKYQDLLKNWAKTSDVSQTPIRAENLGYTFAGKVELMGAILHTGNKSNLEKLLIGRGWGTRLEDGTLDTNQWDAFILKMYRDGVITKADMDFAQSVWDLMETLKPGAQKAHKAMYGFYFNEVTADAIETPFGSYRGGYVPAITDSVMVEDNAINQEKESLKQNNSSMYPTAGRGFTKSRVEQYAAPLAMDLRLVGSHIDKVLRFIHIEPSVKEVARVVMNKGFRAKLAELDPVIGQDMLVPWLQRAAQQTVSTPSKGWAGKAIDTFAKEMRKRAGLQAMFFNITNTMQQVTGFTIAAVRVKPKYLRNAMYRYLKSPKEMAEAVTSRSEFMKTRSDSQVMEVNKIIDELALQPTKFQEYRDFVQQHGYFMQSAAQGFVDHVVWSGAYEEAIADGQTEKEAARIADSAVRETQGSMNPEDMSRFESGSPLVRMFTMFYSYFNMQANLMGTEFVRTTRDMGLRKGAGRLLYVYTMGFMLPAWISTLIVQAMGNGIDEDDDDQYLDDLLSSFFTSQFSTATAMFPIVGPIVNRVALSFNSKPFDDRITLSPAISMIESAGGAPQSVYKAIAEDGSKKKAVRDVMSAIGLLSGIPTGPVQRPLSYLVDVSEGDAEPGGPIDFTRGLMTGKPGQVQ